MNALSRYQPILLSVLRIAAAYMFMLHGSAKLFALPHVEMFDGLQLFSLYGFAGVLEFFGGLLLLIGLFTRPVAFILSGMMAVAYFTAHASGSTVLLPLLNGGEAAALFSFIFIYIAAAGGGAWALDNKFHKAG
ncbi:DoxX family protein [Uruburuella testudinis]|uniref:DoxX family protein n=1 Tax=Uruburuella testudinis TaxID=1282863 RepID=A0ABY4DTI7_9NEIS|nr:DoxX family protein [Uruburuella testudinis]UOO82354.1 DoxX family protein [Uruburuella testudinis]